MRIPAFAAAWVCAGVCVAVASCTGDDTDNLLGARPITNPAPDSGEEASVPLAPGDDGGGITEPPFESVAANVYVAKVKNLLTGLAPTSEELNAVIADPNALKGLIDIWLASPEGRAKLSTFLGLAFQQTQFMNNDFSDMLGQTIPASPTNINRLVANMKESFARTAMATIDENRPFTDTVTSSTFMMTPALMSLLALMDEHYLDDAGGMKNKWYESTASGSAHRNGYTVQNTTVIPYEQSIDPTSPNYMNFYTSSSLGAGCSTRVYVPAVRNSLLLASFLFGIGVRNGPQGSTPCAVNVPITDTRIVPTDFTTWRRVTIRKPAAGEATTRPIDLPKLRTLTELVLDTPRVGFFSTPAFQANWRTNSSNDSRVTTNQTLIVALGASFDPETRTSPASESGLDSQHSAPGTTCYGCHSMLDPIRGYFRKNLTLTYHEQKDPVQLATMPSFSFGGVTATGNTLEDLAKVLAAHPFFPKAWTQKLCFYADSASCSEDDPEFIRIAGAFQASHFDFRTLVRELFSSPLVTGAALTKTFQDREMVVSVARFDHLCRALSVRLGIDACGLNKNALNISSNLPRDAYSRGSEAPVLNSDVSLFYRTGTENLCLTVAEAVVDAPTASKYVSTAKDVAIKDFVNTVMGLPDADPRAAQALQILNEHYAATTAALATPTNALKSTFVLACTAPSAVSIGL